MAGKIASPTNPLTARVWINRVWAWHFGRGLVDSASDFGLRCDKPVHADLLDYLASYLIEHQWSLKALHREILLSATFRQSSANRPDANQKILIIDYGGNSSVSAWTWKPCGTRC